MELQDEIDGLRSVQLNLIEEDFDTTTLPMFMLML